MMCFVLCVRMRSPRLTERDRVKIITLRYDFHRTQRAIAQQVKCSLSSVNYALQQHKQHHDTPRHHLAGRKKKLSPSQQNHLKNIIRQNNNLTSEEIQRHFFHHDNIQISSRTIRRYRRLSFHPATEILIPRLTLQHHLDRIDYCMTHRNNNFHTIVFSDEKSILLSGSYFIDCMDREG